MAVDILVSSSPYKSHTHLCSSMTGVLGLGVEELTGYGLSLVLTGDLIKASFLLLLNKSDRIKGSISGILLPSSTLLS